MVLLLASFFSKAQISNPNLITGQWQDADHPTKQLEIVNISGKYVGKSINNATSSRNGKTILKELVWQESTKSYNGILINPDNNDEFKIKIKLIGTDRFRFSVSKFIFSKTFTFNRIAK
jgi:uncharacterized protein (DUF2147 family)